MQNRGVTSTNNLAIANPELIKEWDYAKNSYPPDLLVNSLNNFATHYPELAEDWDYEKNDLLPTEYLPNTYKKVYWKCHKCFTTWDSLLIRRVQGFRNCPQCTKNLSGFARNKPGFLYIQKIHFQDMDILKYGITNRDPKIRMKEIQKETKTEHTILFVQGFEVGNEAAILEQKIKQYFKNSHAKNSFKFDGCTETLPFTFLKGLLLFIGSHICLLD